MINTIAKKKSGISLIVLVITIIVMIILAGTVVLTLSSTGIMDEALRARKATDLANVKALVDVAWADAYASGGRNPAEIKAIMEKALENEKLDGYNIRVTPYGATVTEVSATEKARGFYSVDGEKNEYGFYFNYPYSINVGALSADSDLPISKLGFILRENGDVDVAISIPNVGNIPITIALTEILELISNGEGKIYCGYEVGAVKIYISNLDENGETVVEEAGRIEFTPDGAGAVIPGSESLMGDETIALNCDFSIQHDIYRDVLYSGVVKNEDGSMDTIKAEYGSDGIFTYYNSKTGETRSIKAEVILGCFLASDVVYNEDGIMTNAKLVAVVSSDGEYLMVEPQDDIFSGMVQGIVRVNK